jgi:molybdate transport repressor ModE-like protein
MELYQLRYLLAIARAGSISGAARDLGVSQSTLSAAVSRLEDECGTTLFLRTRDGVRPTETGALLVERASALLASVERTIEEVREIETEARGRFVIGCHDSLGSYFLPELLRAMADKMPSVELQIWNGSSMDVRDAVLRREVHFGLVVNTLPHLDLVIVDCFSDEIQVLGPSPAPPTLEEAEDLLRKGPLVWPARAPFDEVVRRLAARGLVSQRRIPVGDLGPGAGVGARGDRAGGAAAPGGGGGHGARDRAGPGAAARGPAGLPRPDPPGVPRRPAPDAGRRPGSARRSWPADARSTRPTGIARRLGASGLLPRW